MKPEVLKALRKEEKMTQQQLADLLCVSKSAVSQWEQGRHQPKPDLEMLIANHFAVTLDYLNGNSSFSRFEEVMTREFTQGVSYMEIFDQILSVPESYRMLIKLQLDAIHALGGERKTVRMKSSVSVNGQK